MPIVGPRADSRDVGWPESRPKTRRIKAEQRVGNLVRHTQVFTRPEEKEEAQDEDVGSGAGGRCPFLISQGYHLRQKRWWQRLDARRWRICIGPCPIQRREAEVQLPLGI